MVHYRLSKKAEQDIEEIADYTIESWGLAQAETYINDLHACMTMLGKNKQMGHDASEFSEGLRRFPFKAHTIFYAPTEDGVSIVRVINVRRDMSKQRFQ